MVVRLDTTRDHAELAEDPETILYGSKSAERAPDESSWVPITYVEVFSIDKRRMDTTSLLAKMDVVMRLAKEKMGGIVPKIDDVWKRSNGTYWVVKMVDVVGFDNEYRVHSQKSTMR